jgi:hypothetical protein
MFSKRPSASLVTFYFNSEASFVVLSDLVDIALSAFTLAAGIVGVT